MSTTLTFTEGISSLESCLRKQVSNTDTIRVWTESERLCDKEIGEKYPINYFARVSFSYRTIKNSLNRVKIKALIKKGCPYPPSCANLSPQKSEKLSEWSKNAANSLSLYFAERFGMFLQSIDIFFLPDERKKTFIVPNIYIRNIIVSTDYRGKDIISTDDLVSSWIADLEGAIAFQKAIENCSSR